MKKAIGVSFLVALAFAANAQSADGEIRIARGSDDYPPLEMRVDGKLTGLHVEVVQAVAARIGKKVKWEELPWVRAQKCVEDRECDGISYISPSAEREKWAIFLPGNILSRVDMRFLVHKSNAEKLAFKGKAAEYLSDKTLVVLSGYNYGPDVAKAKKYEVKNQLTLVNLIAEKRNDVAIISNDDYLGFKGKPVFDQLTVLNPPVWESRAFIAFSRTPAGTDTASRFEAAYIDFKKTKDYQALVNRFKANP